MFERTLSALAATVLTIGIVAFSSASAQAAELDETAVSVSFGDLDLSSPKGAARFERRVRNAARQICGWVPAQDIGMQQMVAQCQAKVIADAQADVDLVGSGWSA